MEQNAGLLLTKRAHLNPALEAWVDVATERRFTYVQMNSRCNRTAHVLKELGVKKGDRVALLMMNSIEFMESFFAIAKLGAVCVPLNWRLVPDELQFIIKDAGATVLLYGDEFEEQVTDLHGRGKRATNVKHWICVGQPAPFAKSYASLMMQADDAEPPVVANGDDNLYIMYTSGTTGLPKGVVHTHDTAIWACITMNITGDNRYQDRYLGLLPLFHVGALTPITGAVHRGITNVVARAFDPGQTWQTIQDEQITTMLAVPAMLNAMLQVPQRSEVNYSSLRWIMSGAAPVPVTLIQEFASLGIDINQVYGLTESCGPACLISPDEAISKAGSTGKAFFHTEVRVIDDKGGDIPPGGIGEVIIKGPHIMKEYWNRPDATKETIKRGWLHSGDLATTDEDGFVYIQDRKKDMIISGGENIYPAEIENVILGHPKVRDVAVIGQPSKRWGESPLAVVVKEDESLTAEELLKWCDGKMARFKQPKAVEFIDEIPRNPSGKALKRLLRERFPGPAPE